MKTKQRRADAIENERKVREAANVAFSRRGTLISMDDVAREAGVSTGTVYKTFPSRQELVDEMVLKYMTGVTERLQAGIHGPSVIDALVDAIIVPNMGAAASYWLSEEPYPPKLAGVWREFELAQEAILQRGKDEGVIGDDVTNEDVLFLFAALLRALPPYSAESSEKARHYGRIIIRGLRP